MTDVPDHVDWDWLHETYDILHGWAQSGEMAEDHARLDAIRTELDRAEPVFQMLLTGAERREARLHELETEAAAMTAESDTMAARLAQREARLHEMETEAAAMMAESTAMAARLAQSEASLQLHMEKFESQYREILSLRQALQETERRVRQDLTDLHRRDVMGLKARHAQIRARVEEVEAERKLCERELEKTQADRNRAQKEVKALRSSTSWRLTGPLRRIVRLGQRK